MDGLTVGEAAARTGWSARMLRYLERTGLVVPSRSGSGYRLYRLRELNQLRSLLELRARFGLELADLVFAARLRREPELRAGGRRLARRGRRHGLGGVGAAQARAAAGRLITPTRKKA